MKMPEFGIMISVGKYAGFHFHRGWSWRLCLGWVAITVVPIDGDIILWMSSYFKKR